MATRRQFARSLLAELGIDPSPGAVKALVGWQRAEGGHFENSARFNPLNTTLNMPGSGDTGTQGNISTYRGWRQGLKATARTLENGRYDGILKALRAGDPGAVASAIDASPWGTHGDLVYRTIAEARPGRGTKGIDGVTLNYGGGGGRAPGRNAGGGTVSSEPVRLRGGGAVEGQVAALLSTLAGSRAAPAPASSGVPLPAFAAAPPSAVGSAPIPSGAAPVPQSSALSQALPGLIDSIRAGGSGAAEVTGGGVRVEGGRPSTGSTPSFGPSAAVSGAEEAVAWATRKYRKGITESAGANRGPWVDKLNRSFGMLGQPWCAMFTTTAADRGGARVTKTASVYDLQRWAAEGSNGYRRVSSTGGRPGDFIAVGNDHVVMIKRRTKNGYVIIGGNDSDRVNKRTVSFTYGNVIRPDYPKR